jgi:YD repeat-containing protein
VPGVRVDAERISQAILEQYDQDRDGRLSQGELASLPPIAGNRSWYDYDKDGQISGDELRAGLTEIFDPKVGLLTFNCSVTRNGKPLSGANVRFVPLPALQDAIPPVAGVTDKFGCAEMALAAEDLPANAPTRVALVRPGLYLVQITHPEMSVPEEYNVSTKLGQEVSRFTTAGASKAIRLNF